MEGLAPPLKCLIEIQAALQNGDVLRQGIHRYLQSARASDDFAPHVRQFLFAWEKGKDPRAEITKLRSPQRRALLEIALMGLAGQPVLNHMEELRAEIVSACELEIRHHLEILPVKMLGPLLLFQFPAFLLLMFGPLLARLIEELSK